MNCWYYESLKGVVLHQHLHYKMEDQSLFIIASILIVGAATSCWKISRELCGNIVSECHCVSGLHRFCPRHNSTHGECRTKALEGWWTAEFAYIDYVAFVS